MKIRLINLLNKFPYIRGLVSQIKDLKSSYRFEPGHYHSPIPNIEEVKSHYTSLDLVIKDIDFDFQNQLPQLESFSSFYSELPWSFQDDTKNTNYRFKNNGSY